MRHIIKFQGNDRIRIEVVTDVLKDNMVLNGQMRTATLGTKDSWETFCVKEVDLNDNEQVGKSFEDTITEFHTDIIDKFDMYSKLDSYLRELKVVDIRGG